MKTGVMFVSAAPRRGVGAAWTDGSRAHGGATRNPVPGDAHSGGLSHSDRQPLPTAGCAYTDGYGNDARLA